MSVLLLPVLAYVSLWELTNVGAIEAFGRHPSVVVIAPFVIRTPYTTEVFASGAFCCGRRYHLWLFGFMVELPFADPSEPVMDFPVRELEPLP